MKEGTGNFLKPIPVTTGPTDGLNREVRGDGVTEDMEVVVGEIVTPVEKAAEGTTNPFAPPRFGGGGRRR